MTVVAAGTVVDAWIDRSEYIVRYLEVETTAALGARRVLLPTHFVTFRTKVRQIKVYACCPTTSPMCRGCETRTR